MRLDRTKGLAILYEGKDNSPDSEELVSIVELQHLVEAIDNAATDFTADSIEQSRQD